MSVKESLKKNVHNAGPVGLLINKGQIKTIDADDESHDQQIFSAEIYPENSLKTLYGLEFKERELFYVDPSECEPWKYANRLKDEMGDIDALIESIRDEGQLQPALVRLHPNPQDNI